MPALPRPVRVVHLQGGLRAVDDQQGPICIQTSFKSRFLTFPTPEYSQLYGQLRRLGFKVIGVEFLAGHRFETAAPDWQFSPPAGQFQVRIARQAWSDIGTLASEEGTLDVVEISRRFTTLLDLISIRLLQLSEAYNNTYRASAGVGQLDKENLFDNTYVPYIEAAIHSFLSDAAVLRDLIAEFIWKFVFRESVQVTSFNGFRKLAARRSDPIAASMLQSGEDGWIFKLSRLRNTVLHVAPIGTHQVFPACYSRPINLPGGELAALSYVLTDRSTEALAAANLAISNQNHEEVVRHLQAYKQVMDQSDDALEYAWRTFGELIQLSEEGRSLSGLKGKMLHLTDRDIVDFKTPS